MTLGTYTSGGFKEIDSANMPGWYQFCPPSGVFTSGRSAAIHLKGVTNMAPLPIEVELTAWNNQDAVRGGLTALPNVNSGSAGAIITSGTGTAQISVTGGVVQSDAAKINGVATTSVTTINANIGSTQPLNFTGTGASALLKSDMVDIAGAAVSTTTAQIGANVVQINGQTATAAAGVTFPSSIASPTNITAGTITTATNLTNAPTSGDFTATMKTSLNASTPASVTTVTGNVNGNVGGSVASVTARVTANTDQLGGQTVTAAAGVTFPSSVASPTNITAGTITTATNLTNAPTSGDFTATMKTSLNAATPASVVGAVGSVTGNVGGNVVGSVASVTARVTANTDQLAGQAVTAAAGVTFPASVASPTNITAGTITTTTNLTNAPTAGDFTATMKTSLNAATPASVTGAVGSVTGNVGGNVTGSVGSLASQAKTDVENSAWDAVLANHLTAGSTGAGLNAAGSAGDPWSTPLPGAYGAGTAGKIVGDNLNATVSSRSTYAGTDTAGTTTLLTRVPGTVQPQTGDSFARLGAPAGASVSADIAQVESNVVSIPTAAQNADKVLGRNIAGGSDGGRTVTQALQVLRNKVTTTGGTLTVYAADDATPSWTGVLSTDSAADPIVGVDPA